jgi:autotransporter translocation and assembly factor TamB
MARRRHGLGRVGVLAAGLVVGFAASAVLLYWYVDRGRTRVVQEEVRVSLGLPEDAFRLERVDEDGSLRILLRRVAFLDRAGDTIVTAPTVRGRLVARTLSVGPEVVIDQVVLDRPYLRLLQRRDGEWNFLDIFRAEVDGRPLTPPDELRSRPIAFRGISIRDGSVRIATPFTPPPPPMPGRFASARAPERIETPAGAYTIRRVENVQATLGLLRVIPEGGWRVEISSLTADVVNPDTRIAGLAGWFEQDADETLRFDVREFRTPRSFLAGSGRVRFGDEAPVFDVSVRAAPLAFADLQGMGLPIPEEGTAEFVLDAESRPRGRTLWRFAELDVRALSSRAHGRVTVLTGPGADPVFSDTRLALDPLVLADLEALGYVEDPLPLLGSVQGTVASLDVLELGEGGPLRVDLTASLVPRDRPGAAPSVLSAAGDLRWVPGDAPLRFDGLAVTARPLRLEHLAGFFDAPPGWLRGTVTGTATLGGSPADLRVTGGTVAWAVGAAPETVLSDLSGRFVAGEPVRWQLAARAEPLALATLTELFPALPFRAATLSGPIALTGVGSDVRFDVDLRGATGALAARGGLTLGDPVRFDVSGTVEAFRPGVLLATASPLEGPLTGSFSARGTTNDLAFQVDLVQPPLGRFALGGTLRRTGAGPYRYDVSGRVDDLRVGMLLGRPGLLPGTVSGPISVRGGGGDPVRFDVTLSGELATFDVRGTYLAGARPAYTLTGEVRGLDVSGLPGMGALPSTRLNATLDVDARGTTAGTFAGRIAFDALPGSTVAGLPLEAGRARLVAADGVLEVETLSLAVRGARLDASGRLGLAAPVDGLLRFTVDAPNLAVLSAVLPPPGRFEPAIAGRLSASGWIAGTLESPRIGVNATGSGLRYEGYQAGALTLQALLDRGPDRWTGRVVLEGERVVVGAQSFRTLALDANLAPEGATFGLDARRDGETELQAAGELEMDGLAVRAVELTRFDFRMRHISWRLATDRARIELTPAGLRVVDLRVERHGEALGFIDVQGLLPTTGTADLRIRAEGIDLAELRNVFPEVPPIAGTLVLDAAVVGPVEDPQLFVEGTIERPVYGGVALDRVAFTGEYAARRMRLLADATLAERNVLHGEASIPMTLTLGGMVPQFTLLRSEPVSATVRADSLPLQLVAASVPLFMEDGEGAAAGLIQIGGTLDRPVLEGSAGLRGAVTVVPLGVRWRDIDAALRLEGQTVVVERATARTGDDGTASITGQVVFDQPQAPAVDLLVELDDFLAIDRPRVARLEADAAMRVGGRLPAAELRGWARMENGTIWIPELGAERELDILDVEIGALGADTVASSVATAGLFGMLVPRDVEVEIGDNVWLQSRDARIQIAGAVQVYEAAGSPRIYGDLQTVRGTYTLRLGPIQRDFEIVEGTVQFAGTPDINPRLEITARHRVRTREPGAADISVLVQLGGTVQNPTLALASDTRPPLPESELLTLLIFGRRTYELANIPAEFTQGIILEQLVGGVLTREIEEIFARLPFFDYARLRARPTGTGLARGIGSLGTDLLAFATLELGMQVWEDAFLILEFVDLFSEPRAGVALDWQATDTWALRAAVTPVRRDPLLLNLQQRDYQATVEARRRWEYGRPPEQPDPLADDPPPPPDTPRPAEPAPPRAPARGVQPAPVP